MSDNQNPNNPTPQGNKSGGNVVQKGVQKAQRARKMAQNIKKLAHAVKNIASSGPLMYVLFWVFVVIVALIIITGLIMFIITMPGMIMEKLKALFKEIGNAVAAFFGADTTQQIDEERVYETMDYIEDMGWDLKSEGFLTSYYKDGDESTIEEKIGSDKSYSIDEDQGVVRDDEGNIILAESDFIYTYIMSDNYVYTLKNDNLASQNSADNWWEAFWSGVASALTNIANFVIGPVFDKLGVTEGLLDGWGKGLIVLYYDNGLGKRGDPVNDGTLWNWDSVEINTESKKLSIKRSELFNLNNAIEYSLDGWTGRYGMPLEFLLSVHKATMMPDLAVDMATSFPTNVNVYLHDISGEVSTAYKTANGQYITLETVNKAKTGMAGRNIFSAICNWFDNLIESDEETLALAKLGVDVCDGENGCKCKLETVYYYYNVDLDKDCIMEKDADNNYFYQNKETAEDGSGTTIKKGEQLPESEEGKIEAVKTATDVCDQCHEKSKKITDVLKKSGNDYDFKAYMPYIANVSDHWYRDVYFVLNKDTKEGFSSTDDIHFVDYDYDYESVMKERWTLYETYTDEESDGYKYNPDKVGEFIVFEIDEEGEYKKDASGNYVLYDGTFEEARGDILYVKDENGEYTMYQGVEGEENPPTLYRKMGKDKYEVYDPEKVIAVAKKAITFNASDTDALEDVGWQKTGDIWTAYEEESGYIATGWKRIYTDEELTEVSDEMEKYVKQNSYANMNTKNNIVQVGEGQRTETNPKIKKMFLQNKYFRYDGSEKTAEIITALREEVKNPDEEPVYGALKEEEYEFSSYLDLDEDGNSDDKNGDGKIDENDKYKVKDYAGTVVLNQDSLNAFSMLENTHTLDSDYIYRDFKELVVELGYFEKEELTDETPRILQFPIPEIGSSGYPDRTIDKRENEIGTMIHSKHDIVANKKYTLQELVKQMGEEVSEAGDPSVQNIEGLIINKTENNVSAINSRNDKKQVQLASRVNNDRLSLSANNINISEVGAISAKKSPSQVTVEQYLKETREMCEFINKVGYDYCVMNLTDNCSLCQENGCPAEKRCKKGISESLCGCQTNHCKHNVHENSCGLPATFEDSKVVGKNNLCCATLVSWSLQNVGLMPEDTHPDDVSGVLSYLTNELKAERIETSEELKPGDFLFYDGHVDICGEKIGGNFIRYNGGHQINVGAQQGGDKSSIEIISGWPKGKKPALFAMRLDWGKHEDAPYEGFLGNEAVVSPVSGILVDYGVYDMVEDLNVAEENVEPANPADPVAEEKVGRINVDLKYGPSLNLGNTENTEAKDAEDAANPEEEEKTVAETRELYEKVGYAKILVLNKEIFEMLDSTVTHRWRNDNSNQGLLSKNGQFFEMVTTEEELDELTDESTGDFLSETVYGYKEFAEMYERFGIAGYYVYIDGFKCELPDPDFVDSDEDGELSDEAGNPDGEDLTYDSFKIATTQIEDENELIESLYEAPISFKVASKKATEKLNTEEAIKADTYGALVIDNPKSYEPLKDKEELIFIKEGTVLGRTYTDKELVEERLANGDDPKYNYEYYAPEEDTVTDADGEEEENLDKLIGNYIRIRMMDPVTPIENVEDYMKLDEVVQNEPNDWELFFWLPFESGGTDEDGCGPESQGSCSTGETAVGIIQWTVLTDKNMNNISSQFIQGCLKENYALCAPLAAYASWSADDFWNDWDSGTRAFQKTLSEICDTDRDTFLSVQMQVAKEQYLEPLLEDYPWLADKPSCVQGAVMHLRVWGASTSWMSEYVDASNEDIILKVRNTIANTSSTAGQATGDENSGRAYNEPQIALEILSGAASTEDVEKWVRTRDTSVFDFKFK